MKKCSMCNNLKDESEFHKNKGTPDGLTGKCKSCKSAYDRWLKDNPVPEKGRWGVKSRRGLRNISRYGIMPDDYDSMNEKQNGLCAICGNPPKFPKTRLCVDHDHNTGKVRGLLCNECNVALGAAKDDTGVLRRMLNYLTGASA